MSDSPLTPTGAFTYDTAVLTAEDLRKGIGPGRIKSEANKGNILHSAHTVRGADGTDVVFLIFQNALHAKEFGSNQPSATLSLSSSVNSFVSAAAPPDSENLPTDEQMEEWFGKKDAPGYPQRRDAFLKKLSDEVTGNSSYS